MTLHLRSVGLAVALVVSFGACSTSSDDHGETHDDGGAADGGPAATTDSAGVVEASTSLAAPTLSGVAKMAGGLHVTWKNGQKDCDKTEGERKSDNEPYKVAFSVPGGVDNKHDALGLVAGTAYTYRLRCLKGAAASEYSAEMTGTP